MLRPEERQGLIIGAIVSLIIVLPVVYLLAVLPDRDDSKPPVNVCIHLFGGQTGPVRCVVRPQ